jgi:uncharacterized membrane protein YkvA (DUF1232 family)
VLDTLKRWARDLKAQVITLWFARRHPDMPLCAKIMAVLVVAYAFSPIDLIPDFIPVLGYLDDLVLLPLGIFATLKLVPPHVLQASRDEAERYLMTRKGRPPNYYVAAVIILIWLAAAVGSIWA